MRILLFGWLILSTAVYATTPAKKKKPVHPAAKTAATHKPVSHPTASRTSTAHRTTYGKNSRRARVTTPRYHAQTAPAPDRVREIQGALAAKGYLKSTPSGAWDAESQDALKKFQGDQKLDQTGKLNSLSLIALGLGPKPAETPSEAH